MRYFLLFSLLILACNNQQEDYITLLEGTWSYEPIAWNGDTIISGLIDDFDGELTEYAIRKLDSGIFLEVYVNNEIRLSEKCNYVWLTEFLFDSDTTGYIADYVLDTANKQGRAELSTREYLIPREDRFLLTGTTQDLKLITLDEYYSDTASILIYQDKIEMIYKPDKPITFKKYKP